MSIEDLMMNSRDNRAIKEMSIGELKKEIVRLFSEPIGEPTETIVEKIVDAIDALIVARIQVAKGCKVPGCQCPDA